MTVFARAMEILFVCLWLVGVGAWIYSARYFLPMWAEKFRANPKHSGYPRKAITGVLVFLAAVVCAFAVGGLAELDGGWS